MLLRLWSELGVFNSKLNIPALLKSTSRRSLSWRKTSAEALIVVRSSRSRCRNVSEPLEFGARVLISEIAFSALAEERAAT